MLICGRMGEGHFHIKINRHYDLKQRYYLLYGTERFYDFFDVATT